MFQNTKSAFTLVELVVVITILAILWTIGFISIKWYSETARDSARLSDMNNIWKSLELFMIESWKYPIPDSNFQVSYSWWLVWTQWIFWSWVFTNVWKLSNIPLDPLTSTKYSYSVSSNKKEYQLWWISETGEYSLNSFSNNVNAEWEINAKALIIWNYNWIAIKSNKNSNCNVLALPSIITSEEESDLLNILSNDSLVYNWKWNLPSSFTWSKFKMKWWFWFTTTDIVAYSDTNNCNQLYSENDWSKRTDMLTKIKDIYDNSVIVPYWLSDSTPETLVNNNFWGKLKVEDGIKNNDIFLCTSWDVTNFQDALNNKDFIISNIWNYVWCEIFDYDWVSIPWNWVYIVWLTSWWNDIMVVSKEDALPWLLWKDYDTLTLNTTSRTDWLLNTNSIELSWISSHPAWEFCRNIWVNWYLPSINELNLIYSNKSYLGEFYDVHTHWSSTEAVDWEEWAAVIDFNDGSEYEYYKTSNWHVRCSSKF